MPQVSVELGERSYVIDIAPGLLHSGRVAEVAPHTEIMVVTDDQLGTTLSRGTGRSAWPCSGPDAHDSGGRGVQKLASVEAVWSELMQGSVQSQMLFDRFGRRCDRGHDRLCCGLFISAESILSKFHDLAGAG